MKLDISQTTCSSISRNQEPTSGRKLIVLIPSRRPAGLAAVYEHPHLPRPSEDDDSKTSSGGEHADHTKTLAKNGGGLA